MKKKKYHIVRTETKNTTPSEQKQKIPHRQNRNKKYHTVRTEIKNTTPSEQLKYNLKIPHRQNS
jgi:hypothetical protein